MVTFSRILEFVGVLFVTLPMLLSALKNDFNKKSFSLFEATILYLALYLVLYNFVWVLISDLLYQHSSLTLDLARFMILGSMFLIPFSWWKINGLGLDQVGITKNNFLRGISRGSIVGIVWVIPALLLWTLQSNTGKWLGFHFLQTLISGILYTLFVALAEETIYRGVVQTELTKALGFKSALFLTAISFSMIHGRYYALPPVTFFFTQVLGPLSGGFILGYLFKKEGLHAAIMCHFVFNAFLYLFYF